MNILIIIAAALVAVRWLYLEWQSRELAHQMAVDTYEAPFLRRDKALLEVRVRDLENAARDTHPEDAR
jgi:hypothetical protein